MAPRPAPATEAEVLDVLAQTYSGRDIPRAVGAVADDIARARGWDGYTTRDGQHNNRMTTAQFVAEWVSQASVARVLDALVEKGEVVTVTTDDAAFARSPHMRKNSTYYVSATAHQRATEAFHTAQTALQRVEAERRATEDLVAEHKAEWDRLVEDHMAAAAIEPKDDLDPSPVALDEPANPA